MRRGDAFPIFSVYHQFYVLGSKNYRIKSFYKHLFLPGVAPLGGDFLINTAYGLFNVGMTKDLWIFRLDVQSGKMIQ